jgi:hypothetical protein
MTRTRWLMGPSSATNSLVGKRPKVHGCCYRIMAPVASAICWARAWVFVQIAQPAPMT